MCIVSSVPHWDVPHSFQCGGDQGSARWKLAKPVLIGFWTGVDATKSCWVIVKCPSPSASAVSTQAYQAHKHTCVSTYRDQRGPLMEQGLLLAVFSLWLFHDRSLTLIAHISFMGFWVFLGQNRTSRQKVISKRNAFLYHTLTCSTLSSKPTRHLVNSITWMYQLFANTQRVVPPLRRNREKELCGLAQWQPWELYWTFSTLSDLVCFHLHLLFTLRLCG